MSRGWHGQRRVLGGRARALEVASRPHILWQASVCGQDEPPNAGGLGNKIEACGGGAATWRTKGGSGIGASKLLKP